MQTSLTTFSSIMLEQFAALTNSVGEIQQRLINLEENMTLSSMVSITVFSLLAVVWLHLLISSSRDRKLSLSGRILFPRILFGCKNIYFY